MGTVGPWNVEVLVFIAVIGLVVGSFLAVVAHRVPAGGSLLRPRSACPQCGHQLGWWENIPVLSWLVLRRRCRRCKGLISAHYVVIELLTAGVALVLAGIIGPKIELITWWVVAAFCVPLAVIDVHHRRLPVRLMYPAQISCALAVLFTATWTTQWSFALRAALGALALGMVFYFLWWATAGRGMGKGDVRLAFLLGMPLGWMGWPEVIFGGWLGFISGAVVAGVLMASGRVGRKSPIPFGPHMMIGAVAGLWWGPALAQWIINF